MTEDTAIKENLARVRQRIRTAALACGRSPEGIRLIAVSKSQSAQTVARGIDAGITDLGENYIQEAREKIAVLQARPVTWHFIGHLQSNKARYAAGLFDLIHCLDSVKLARELDKYAAGSGIVQKVLIQVNIGDEATKSGVPAGEAADLAAAVSSFKHISVRGLMALPPVFDDPEQARPCFAAVRKLAEEIRSRRIPGIRMDELSMGMSGDFEAAIAEGATLVRIGTALFGERP
ncbi:MAG: YggS family pyridoxal phosphate-dependent enzyme [Thermodesulfobacteriota bacterium]